MQFAVRYDKTRPASHIDTCEAVARAAVGLISSTEARAGEWREAVDFWRDGRIRKLVRRARGAVRWDEVQAVPGVTVQQGGDDEEGVAGARAFVPAPVRPLDPILKKLQVEGTELPDLHPSRTVDALVTVGISPNITMTTGKAAAQCAHAAQLAWEAMDEPTRQTWAADGHRLRVEVIDEARWATDPGRVQVVDAGFTELDGPTETTRAWW
ncbi:peptidyl-tRNA hydrolase [Luteococcus sp. H138]|uniref:peptidyl-tRNA hydrolase n=1 Tax=unclassified Luteococcus TaxID=2639923 RepID=UPI00313D1696